MTIKTMRLTIPLAIGAALMLSAPALAQDKKAEAPGAKPDSTQTRGAPAASETIINLKVTGMT